MIALGAYRWGPSVILLACASLHAHSGLEFPSPVGFSLQESATQASRFMPKIVVRICVALPNPISEAEEDSLIRSFGLQGEVAARVRIVLHDFAALEALEYPKIFARAFELAESIAAGEDGIYTSVEYTALYEPLLRERKRAMSRLASFEEGLFVTIADCMESEIGPSFGDALRQFRRRMRACQFPCELPMAELDLRHVAFALDEGASKLEVLAPDAWPAALSAYDFELASLHEQRVERKLKDNLEDAQYFHRFNRSWQAVADRRTELMRSKLQPERVIVDANRRWAVTLTDMLSPKSATAFKNLVDSSMYPALYPRPVDLRSVLASIPAPSDANRKVVERLRGDIDSELAQLDDAEKLAESQVMELAVWEARAMMSPELRAVLQRQLETLRATRCAAAKRVMAALASLPEITDSDAIRALALACSECP